jgi:O-antigen/teichoic acid export membrane protein
MEKMIRSLLERTPFLRGRMKGHLGEILEGAAVAFLLRSLGAFLAFAFTWILARSCGAGGAGLYYLALTVVTLSTVLGKMGLDSSLLRFTAANAAVGDWGAVKGVYVRAMRLALAASGALSLLILAFAPFLSARVFHKPELTVPMRWMALALAPMSFFTLQAEALKGLKKIRDAVFLAAVALPLAASLGLLALGGRWGASGAAMVYALACLATALLGWGLWRSATPHLAGREGAFAREDLLKSSLPLFGTTVLETLTNWMSVFFLGLWSTKAQVGVFGAALRTAMAVSLILMAVNSVAAPKFAALYRQKRLAELDETARQSAKLMTLLAGPLLGLFLVFPGRIMAFFGPDFRAGGTVLAVLAVGQFVNVATGSVGYLLIMSGNERLMQGRAAFIAGLGLVLNLLLVPRWGALGAGLATAVSVASTNLIAVFLVHSKLGIWTLPFPFPKPPNKD